MREIKFRAWDIIPYYDDEEEKREMIYFDLEDTKIIENLSLKSIEMQYTGLNDKNGKEMFEKDIINVKTYSDDKPLLAVVKFGEGIFDDGAYKFTGFYLDFGSNYQGEDMYQLDSESVKHYEIVGNVYEDLKLLGEKCI